MKHLTILVLSLFVSLSISIIISVHASAQEYSIPNWVKNMTRWWSQGQISNSDFIKATEYLIDNNILHPVSQTTPYPLNVTSNSSNLQNQNDPLSQRLNDLQSQYDTLQTRYNLLLQQFRSITTQSTASGNNIDSISAVAVTPVLESDGFFETTKYQSSILKITIEIRDGTGLVLVNTAIPSGVDFQTSARTAVTVAQNVTNVDLSKKDVIFSISTGNNQDLQAVDGGSAGGAMTVLLVSDLLGKSINNQVLMTGTI